VMVFLVIIPSVPAALGNFVLPILGVGIEGILIQGDTNAAIAQMGKNAESIFEAMVGETVGVVAEKHQASVVGSE